MTKTRCAHNGQVFLVDDDSGVRRGVSALLGAADYTVTSFTSGEDFLSRLEALDTDKAALLLDVCMPGVHGLELQERLTADGVDLPVIVMTAHGDVPMAVRAMQNGAVDFLEKPFTVSEVTSALDRAFNLSRPVNGCAFRPPQDLSDRYQSLTPRESEVLHEIVSGSTNKEIARTLDVSPRTIETHRLKIMQKMRAKSFAELVRMAVMLNIGD